MLGPGSPSRPPTAESWLRCPIPGATPMEPRDSRDHRRFDIDVTDATAVPFLIDVIVQTQGQRATAATLTARGEWDPCC